MATRTHFVANPTFARDLARMPAVGAAAAMLARGAEHRYAETLPRRTGRLARGAFSDVARTPAGWRGRVGNEVWYAGLIEFGTARGIEPGGQLRRATESVGLKARP